jgi:inorganic pyrophosphatase
MLDDLGAPADRLSVIIEVPRGGHIKRALDARGGVSGAQLISPLPCPFNYGCAPALGGQDGDPLDAIVLGPALRLGERLTLPVVGVVRFVDRGAVDDKWILSATPPTLADDRALRRFFRLYAFAKRWMNLPRRGGGETTFRGVHWRIPPLSAPL